MKKQIKSFTVGSTKREYRRHLLKLVTGEEDVTNAQVFHFFKDHDFVRAIKKACKEGTKSSIEEDNISVASTNASFISTARSSVKSETIYKPKKVV